MFDGQINSQPMKVLKNIGFGLLGLAVLLYLGSFLLPSHVTVERSAVFKAPAPVVFEQVNKLQNWEKWSPWHQIDPAMKLTYEGPDAGVGAKYNWFSEHPNVGNGSLTITKSIPNQHIATLMQFEGQNDGLAFYTFEETTEGIKVTWRMESEMGSNPLNKYMGLMMDSFFVGPSFEQGLESLRTIVEQRTAAAQ